MCGRFVSASPPADVARYFDAEAPEAALDANYNVAPTNDVYVVLSDGSTRRVAPMHWGLVPRWAKDPSVGNRMINARAETLASKGAFKPAFTRRRCIVPADGFYEWKKLPGQKRKQPYFIHRPDDEPFAFAGLWDVARLGGKDILSAAIIVGEPNPLAAAIHDRMPVILDPATWAAWLDDAAELDELLALLVPAPDEVLDLHAVSSDVGNVKNNDPHLIDPIDEDDLANETDPRQIPGQGSLL